MMVIKGLSRDNEYVMIAAFDDHTVIKISGYPQHAIRDFQDVRVFVIFRYGQKVLQYHGTLDHDSSSPVQHTLVFKQLPTLMEVAEYLFAIQRYLQGAEEPEFDNMKRFFVVVKPHMDAFRQNQYLTRRISI